MKQTTLKILVADNDSSQRAFIEKAFSENHINGQVDIQEHFSSAMDKIDEEEFDILFISSQIPGANAIQLMNKARQKNKFLPVIFITPKTNNDFFINIIKEGATDCISRPLMITEMLPLLVRQTQYRAQLESALSHYQEEGSGTGAKHFLMDISHQIRTPLNSIIGFSTAMLEMERNEKDKEFLEAIKTSGDKILELIDGKLSGQGFIPNTGERNITSFKKPLTRVHFSEIMKLKILLVEDDIFNIKLVEHLFSEYGMKADVALNGKLAVEKIANNKYDLVLMDMEMPEMDGYEATIYTRKELKNNVPIIALTAHAMAGEREKCLQMGMNEYITKPINANHLFEIIYRTVKPTTPEQKRMPEAVTDLNYLKETMNGKKEAIKEMLTYLLKQLPEYLAALNKAIEQTEYPAIAKLSHKIKSAVAIIGVKRLQPILVEMEALGKSNSNMDKLRSLHIELNSISQLALKEIKKEQIKYQ